MLKLYCQKCGALNSYVSEKPNFCQKCGQSFSTEQPAAPTSPQPEVKAQVAGITTEDDEGTINFNNLSAFFIYLFVSLVIDFKNIGACATHIGVEK